MDYGKRLYRWLRKEQAKGPDVILSVLLASGDRLALRVIDLDETGVYCQTIAGTFADFNSEQFTYVRVVTGEAGFEWPTNLLEGKTDGKNGTRVTAQS